MNTQIMNKSTEIEKKKIENEKKKIYGHMIRCQYYSIEHTEKETHFPHTHILK